MPVLRPFRALRFDSSAVGDPSAVVSPPYDVISAEHHAALLARHPANIVRVEAPLEEPGEAPEERYRRAARDFVSWRTQGLLRKDPLPSIYVYEQAYRVPGDTTSEPIVQRGFFARIALEPFAPGSAIRPHERTMSGPKEDRYQLLRSTGANLSAVMLLYDGGGAGSADHLAALTERDPDAEATDDDGVRHRVWVVPARGPDAERVAALMRLGGAESVTIADGHHRYETALRYRQERGRHRACESDPAYDYILALFQDAAVEPLTVLATHRVLKGGPSGEELLGKGASLFDVEPVGSSDALVSAFPVGRRGSDTVRIGFWSGGHGAILRARGETFDALLDRDASEAARWLDVTVLGAALENLAGVDPAAAAGGGRLIYTKDPSEAVALVDAGTGAAAFLLDPTPVSAITTVAAGGEVMPQKSTYFYPKVVTGLLVNPHES